MICRACASCRADDSPGPYFLHPLLKPTLESPCTGLRRPDGSNVNLLYKRSFTVPPAWGDSRVLLHFGAVDYECTVSVNHVMLGVHHGGCALLAPAVLCGSAWLGQSASWAESQTFWLHAVSWTAAVSYTLLHLDAWLCRSQACLICTAQHATSPPAPCFATRCVQL